MSETTAPDDETLFDLEEAMRDVVDPELGINVVDLGLVYGLNIEQSDEGTVALIDMTLTSAACPLTDVIEDQSRCEFALIERYVFLAVAARGNVARRGVRPTGLREQSPADEHVADGEQVSHRAEPHLVDVRGVLGRRHEVSGQSARHRRDVVECCL